MDLPDPRLLGWTVEGAVSWTLPGYRIHRFVLHGLAPFKQWHIEHHCRTTALIAARTLLSAGFFGGLLIPVA